MTNSTRTWYEFALLQVAAESYLDDVDPSNLDETRKRFRLGNNDLRPDVFVNGVQQRNSRFGQFDEEERTPVLPGATRLTESQAQYVTDNWEVIHQRASDPSGFSATLLRHRTSGEYTLAFRSTEFFKQEDGGDFQRDVTGADLGIGANGFALAQLSAMERY